MVASHDALHGLDLHEEFVLRNQSREPKSSADASQHHSEKSELLVFKTLGPVCDAFDSESLFNSELIQS